MTPETTPAKISDAALEALHPCTDPTPPPASEATVPTHEACVDAFNDAWNKAMEGRCVEQVCDEAGISAVREACLKAMPTVGQRVKVWTELANAIARAERAEKCAAYAPAWVPTIGEAVLHKSSRKVHKVSDIKHLHGRPVILLDGRGETPFGLSELEPIPPPAWSLPPGDWHRKDGWREEWLQDGWRPLLKGEIREEGDQFYPTAGCEAWVNNWQNESGNSAPPYRADDKSYHSRTRRPLPSPPKVEMPKIKTRFIHPPIPIRSFDWEATRDGYDKGDPVGFGRTEELAKADLLEQEGGES
jgi:hypothetical protein